MDEPEKIIRSKCCDDIVIYGQILSGYYDNGVLSYDTYYECGQCKKKCEFVAREINYED